MTWFSYIFTEHLFNLYYDFFQAATLQINVGITQYYSLLPLLFSSQYALLAAKAKQFFSSSPFFILQSYQAPLQAYTYHRLSNMSQFIYCRSCTPAQEVFERLVVRQEKRLSKSVLDFVSFGGMSTINRSVFGVNLPRLFLNTTRIGVACGL